MRPRERRESGEQDLFRSRLDQVIDMDHALAKLARTIDWGFLEEKFGEVYKDGAGQPPLPTRLMAGLAILKHTYKSQRRGRELGNRNHDWREDARWSRSRDRKYHGHQIDARI